ncbi:SDR family NAD(P)-dependent oxidoreductase [Dyadobacter chenwenxiniae]|uniref:SDR family NAD(P)-dependent oxidoreductase n=1 Tax=Dyadobacter chenwenxiniae TaxID=2906456 RepID=A0A9X1PI11_9BACT|nr:SDR family NAD(P)-dependent oxidoreductase [Dyadobacter chenwenxiniae]MCF0060269.1 SDR family NAD(P)-dependent oxidoreductase [Dyadobacter chenwenxiniae]UON86007.1 SDR family NAD(P)-dependent oxidoreductase [Dyadobacter chenwenxiniae]
MKNILITGGTGNLGQTVVKTLSDHGYHLHLAVRSDVADNAENVSYYPTDIADNEQAERLLAKIVSENVTVNAGVFLAGGFEPGKLAETSMDDISRMISINFATAFTVAQKLITHYKTAGGGKLIFVGAKAAMNPQAAASSLAYSLSKQLLYNFSELINESEKSAGTTSHILLPGIIDTTANRKAMPEADFSKWISPADMAATIGEIIAGNETRAVIEF